jgi:sporulation protein YlmC with PRC-barrel domain
MYRASELKSYEIQATDGQVGSVTDFLFDDQSWQARWVVVDVGGWLSRQEVLMPTSHLGDVNRAARAISVDLTRAQVKDSPDPETHRPVSRQFESSLYEHYGWMPYWGVGATGAGAGYLIPPRYPPLGARRAEPPRPDGGREENPHLRSAREVTGYRIEASDGEIGHVEDFLFGDDSWTIRYLIVDTKNWWPGKFVLIVPEWAEEIRWSDRIVRVNRGRDEIKAAPEFDPKARFERADEARLYDYYRVPGYWIGAPRD